MPSPNLPLAKLSRHAQWILLLAGSAVLGTLLELMRLPAALLLGPMISAILVETGGGSIRLPQMPRFACQAVIGCMIARTLNPAIFGTFLKQWPLFLGLVFSIIAASSLLGWAMSRWRILPGTTAVWGLSPGAANAMVLMAGAFGADTRLVAFMQYLRVIMVATLATLVARFWVGAHGPGPAMVWFPAIQWLSFAETLAIVIFGGVVGWASRLPAAVFLGPMIVGTVLHSTGLVVIELPPWLLAASYAFLGWSIGLGFTREILGHAFRALPQIILAIVALILFAGGLAFILVQEFHVDPLTAYLATSPGGADSVAIIAASSKVDVSFVMALQMVRFLILLIVGPVISRFVAGQIPSEFSAGPEAAVPASSRAEIKETLQHVKEDQGELD
jgi:membrane AbrB-like protein